MVRKGQEVYIRPEWQDEGDDRFIRIAIEDEDGGRVKVRTVMPDLTIQPVSVIETRMLTEGDPVTY